MRAGEIPDQLALQYLDDTRALLRLSPPEQDAMCRAMERAYRSWIAQSSPAQRRWADRGRREFDVVQSASELSD